MKQLLRRLLSSQSSQDLKAAPLPPVCRVGELRGMLFVFISGKLPQSEKVYETTLITMSLSIASLAALAVFCGSAFSKLF